MEAEEQNVVLTFEQSLAILKAKGVNNLDIRILESQVNLERVEQPLLVWRVADQYFILLVEQIKVVCYHDYCIFFNKNNKMNAKFIEAVAEYCKYKKNDSQSDQGDNAVLRSLLCKEGVSLQNIVLDLAFQTVVEKYKKHLKIMKPVLDQLLLRVEEDHEASGLKELMAVKKSLSQFKQNVEDVETQINLFSQKFGENNVQELIFEYFNHNINEIEFETKKMIQMIEDCEQFVSIHLDTVRNQIMKISVFIEFGALTCGFGMLVGGFFGMNTKSGLEDERFAWIATVTTSLFLMAVIFGLFTRTYFHLKDDTSTAQRFNLLKSVFTYIDDLEYYFRKKNISKKEFKNAIEIITKMKITERENNYLFNMMDINKDGVTDK